MRYCLLVISLGFLTCALVTPAPHDYFVDGETAFRAVNITDGRRSIEDCLSAYADELNEVPCNIATSCECPAVPYGSGSPSSLHIDVPPGFASPHSTSVWTPPNIEVARTRGNK